MTEAMAHVDHCELLVTACLHQTERGRMITLAVQQDATLAPIELVGMGEGLAVLAQQLIDQGHHAQARSN